MTDPRQPLTVQQGDAEWQRLIDRFWPGAVVWRLDDRKEAA